MTLVLQKKRRIPFSSACCCPLPFIVLPVRLGEPRRAGEEENPSDHLHRLPPLLRCGLPYPAGERADRPGGRPLDQPAGAARRGHLPRDGRHQESETGAAGEERKRGGSRASWNDEEQRRDRPFTSFVTVPVFVILLVVRRKSGALRTDV